MGRIILPNRFLRQPINFPRIDRSTNIGKAVSACVVGNHPQLELVGGSFRAGGIGNLTILAPSNGLAGGVAYQPLASDTTFLIKNPEVLDFRQNSISIFWHGQIVPNTNVRSIIEFRDGDYGWEIFADAWSAGTSALNFIGYWQGGSGIGAADVATEGIISIGVSSRWVSTSASDGKMFADGKEIDSASMSPDEGNVDGTANLRMNDVDQQMLVCYIFNRDLTQQEQRWLHFNPYGLFHHPKSLLTGAGLELTRDQSQARIYDEDGAAMAAQNATASSAKATPFVPVSGTQYEKGADESPKWQFIKDGDPDSEWEDAT